MNYYPYYTTIPYTNFPPVTRGGLSSLFGGIKWGSILNGTQKTLGIVNQAIPIIKQAGPVINNAKTIFRVMNEFKKVDNIIPEASQEKNAIDNNINKKVDSSQKQNNPIFFQ